MIAPGGTREYWTWIPRSTKFMPGGIDKIMSAGQQIVVRYVHSAFQENFFDQPIEVAEKFVKDMSKYLMVEYNFHGFEKLHKLGYLPIKIKALPEGLLTQPRIPHMTGINTVDGYDWFGLFLETLISKLAWQCPTAATIAHKFKQNAVEWVKKTDEKNLWLADFMCHDFHSRGGNPFTSIAVGLGNVIPASRYYYDFDENEVPVYSVNASEHSVSCTKIFTVGEKQMLSDWMKLFPKGILSVVMDTMDITKVVKPAEDGTLQSLKEEILAREGKLVIRPDSSPKPLTPLEIICGWGGELTDRMKEAYYPEFYKKGLIECLWDIFGGTINEQGFKVLDSHIGAIYGDAINLERQVEIYKALAAKGFAATNIVLGVGSYTYVMLTRDSAGYAAKGAWFEVEEFPKITPNADGTVTDLNLGKSKVKTSYDIYKDPVTDDGTKKSLRGMIQVFEQTYNEDTDKEYTQLEVKQECTFEEESQGLLQTIYEDGKFFNQTTLTEIRKKLSNN